MLFSKINQDSKKKQELSAEELRDILEGVKELADEDLERVVGGGDDRTEYTNDAGEIEADIYGELAED